MVTPRLAWLPALLVLVLAEPAAGQRAIASRPPLATIATWANQVWLVVLDRDGGYFGRLADQGLLQRFNPLMDDEYELDLWTGLFSPAEDARWAAAARGLRAGGTSISHPHTVHLADWRHQSAVAGPVDFLADYARRGSLTEQRDYLRVGARWNGVLDRGLAARVLIGVHFFKPSGDVEFALSRAWTGAGGSWHLDAGFAFLDAFSNVVFNWLEVSPQEADAQFDYGTPRYATRLAVQRATARYRLELHGGATNRTRAAVTFRASGAPGYTLREHMAFAGALGELRLGRRAGIAAFATVIRAETNRDGVSGSGVRLHLRETTTTLGGSGWYALDGGGTGVEADARVVWRPEDRQSDGAALVQHEDREVLLHLGLARRPLVSGWQWRVTVSRMDRSAGALAAQLAERNHRNLMEAGYRFRSGFELMGGVRWDLDRLRGGTFDGGHLRLMAAW
jgi:hypothetical protein